MALRPILLRSFRPRDPPRVGAEESDRRRSSAPVVQPVAERKSNPRPDVLPSRLGYRHRRWREAEDIWRWRPGRFGGTSRPARERAEVKEVTDVNEPNALGEVASR